MKKFTLLITFLMLLTGLSATAKLVEKKDAKLAGKNFYYERLVQHTHQSVPYSSVTISQEFVEKDGNTPVYYIFNFAGNGYIMISADDCCYPVIGYSFDSQYNPENLPENFAFWMDGRKHEIIENINNSILPDFAISNEWNRLATFDPSSLSDSPSVVTEVAPLLTSLWDQGFPYNVLCPAEAACGTLGGHVTVGCVATAMSQIMYYWRWPVTGTGSHCYTPSPTYGQLCADFGNTTYDWNGMTDAPTSECYPAALISFHAGVSVNMKYNSTGDCASGAYTSSVPGAFKNYFKYASTCTYAEKSSYSTSSWNTMITDDLNASKPVQYSGSGSGGGHSWVCDGYQGTDYFHMNWGWSGSSNGYFYLNNLNPSGYVFNNGQAAVFHIEPNSTYSTGCTGDSVISTYDFGSIEDGSGPVADYQNNSNCTWLIAIDDSVQKVTLNFTRFATSNGDLVNVYDGGDATAPLLGTYSGDLTVMPTVTTTGPKMFITFTSDGSGTSNGWSANYTTTPYKFCNSSTTLYEAWGNIKDGSERFPYRNLANCKWNIMPPGCSKLVLTVNSFNTETDNDRLLIYDLGTGTQIASLSGSYTTLPGPFTTTTGKMMLQWFSNNTVRGVGWDVSYSPMVGTDDQVAFSNLLIYPNPASQLVNIEFTISEPQNVSIEILSLKGESLFNDNLSYFKGPYHKAFDVSAFTKGIYMLRLKSDQGTTIKKIVVQ
jgi:hypothetical protein